MRKDTLPYLVLLTILFLSLAVSANTKYYSNTIQDSYRVGETIKGKVNLSFNQEPVSSIFSSNFQGNITLLALLEKNGFVEGRDFNCSLPSCIPQYALESSISEFNLDQKKIVGLEIQGNNIEEISSLRFDVENALPASCSLPLLIDPLDDKKDILSSNSYNDNVCSSKFYGCFDSSSQTSSVVIADSELCESIKVNPAPAYRIGARVINSTKGKGELEMILYDSQCNDHSCILSEQSSPNQDLDCIINVSAIEKTNFTVCIRNNDYSDLNSPNYKIRTETTSPVCGNHGRDFEIYAVPLEYSQSPIKVNNDLFETLYSGSLEDEVFQYIKDNYKVNEDGSVRCNPSCIVPIAITGPSQNIKFTNVDMVFRDGGLVIDDNQYKQFFDLSIEPVKITSPAINIDLSKASFVIPFGTNEESFKLYADGVLLFKKDISIAPSFDFDVLPKFVLFGVKTNFEVQTSFNITSSEWDFGDGTTSLSPTKSISHQYLEEKTYSMEVKLVRKDGIIAIKKFDVIVGNPKEAANRTLTDYEKRIIDLSKKVDSYPAWIKTPLTSTFDPKELNLSLDAIKKDYLAASSDEDYIAVMNGLLALKIPLAISYSKQGTLPLAVGFNNIDPQYLEEISKDETQDSEKLKQYIIGWYNNHYKSDVKFNVLSVNYENEKEDILTQFSIKIDSLPDNKDSAYLFINYPFESITFNGNYGQQPVSEGSGSYIPIKPESQTLEFLINENVEVSELGAYISPEISKLSITGDIEVCLPGDKTCQKPFPWARLLFWLALVLGITLVAYIILQEWYKKHYEHHLFKNPNDLYNLINFIYNSRVSGLRDSEIKSKLKGTGWSNEKITYAFKKIDGRRTGMWEIPLFKMFENKKVRTEIQKRQSGPLDA